MPYNPEIGRKYEEEYAKEIDVLKHKLHRANEVIKVLKEALSFDEATCIYALEKMQCLPISLEIKTHGMDYIDAYTEFYKCVLEAQNDALSKAALQQKEG